MNAHFHCWCTALKVDTFEKLADLVVLEQFKNSVPEVIANYVNDHKVTNATDAAALADDYVLTHKHSFGDVRTRYVGMEKAETSRASFFIQADKVVTKDRNSHVQNADKICNLCRKRGHWKADCYVFKAKVKSGAVVQPKGVCSVMSIAGFLLQGAAKKCR